MENIKRKEIFILRDGEEIAQKEFKNRFDSLTSESKKDALMVSLLKIEVR